MDGRTLKTLWGLWLLAALLPAQAQEVFYIHTDALGSPVAETDANRYVVQRFEYEPYGRRLNGGNDDKPGYTGHVMDAVTGLTYMQQRYYDPGIGMFLSVDPVTAHSDPVGQFHRYRYANNNPYKFTDPDGREVTCSQDTCTSRAHTNFERIVDLGTIAVIYARRLIENAVVEAQHNDAPDRDGDEPEYTDGEGNQPPFTGEPGSTVRGGTGSRTYGEDGYPKTDRDTPHPDEKGRGNQDHVHDWGRPEGGGPPRSEDRGPSREPKPGDPPKPRGPNVPPDKDKLRH